MRRREDKREGSIRHDVRVPLYILVIASAVFWHAWAIDAQPASGAQAGPVGAFHVPPGVLGSWVFDPGDGWEPAGPTPVLVALRTAIGAGLVRGEDSLLAAKIVLGLAQIGEHAHRAFVLGFRARPFDRDGGMILENLELVVEVRTERSHLPMVSTLEASLTPGEPARQQGVTAAQRAIRLEQPDGTRVDGVVFTRSDWPEWAEVSWASEPGVFTVTLGRGVLGRWVTMRRRGVGEGPSGLPSEIAALRAGGLAAAPGRREVFEAWASVDALRRGFPEAFDSSRAQRIFQTLGILNARSVAVVGNTAGPGAGPIDLEWAVDPRSEPPGSFERERLTIDARTDMPGGFTIHFANRLVQVEALGARVFQAARRVMSQAGQRIKRRQWVAKHGNAWREFADSLQDEVVVIDDQQAPVRFPGVGVAVSAIRAGRSPDRVEMLLDRMLGEFAPVLRKDRRSGLWSLVPLGPEEDPTGVLRLGALGVVRRGGVAVVAVGWSSGAVERGVDRFVDAAAR